MESNEITLFSLCMMISLLNICRKIKKWNVTDLLMWVLRNVVDGKLIGESLWIATEAACWWWSSPSSPAGAALDGSIKMVTAPVEGKWITALPPPPSMWPVHKLIHLVIPSWIFYLDFVHSNIYGSIGNHFKLKHLIKMKINAKLWCWCNQTENN